MSTLKLVVDKLDRLDSKQQLFLKLNKIAKISRDRFYTIRKCGTDEYLSDMKANGECVWCCGSNNAMKFNSHHSCEIFNDIAEGIISYNIG